VHRPLAAVSLGPIHDINTTALYRDTVRELKSAPERYLRLLSIPPTTEPMTLRVETSAVRVGHAWAGAAPGELTHEHDTLVPVTMFYASGTTASGAPVSAMFTVDAMKPEFRSPVPSAVVNITADDLLKRQLGVTLGGHRPELMSAEGVLRDELPGFACAAGSYVLTPAGDNTSVATLTCPNGARITLTLSRAFPGLVNSIWYVASVSK